MSKYVVLCIAMTVIGAFGGYAFKKASSNGQGIIKTIFSPYLYLGGVLYAVAALLNIWVLKELKYTVVLPVTSITYIWSLGISHFLLKERLTVRKFAGVGLIILGTALLAAV